MSAKQLIMRIVSATVSPFVAELDAAEVLKLKEIIGNQHFTQPPARFTEASLVKELEKSGIGRPSTYATIMNKIQSRDYTVKEKGSLKPTELGKVIAQMLEENFKMIMDVGFTSAMEDELEEIAYNHKNWKVLLHDFWERFIPFVVAAEKEAFVPRVATDIDCPNCRHKLEKIWARNKYFYGCSNYPKCDFASWDKPVEGKCPECNSYLVEKNNKIKCSNCSYEKQD